MACLSEETRQAAERHTYLALPTHGNDSLYRALRDTLYEIPLKEHLRAKLIDGHGLNRSLAGRLAACDNVDRRLVVEQARSELHEHRSVLQGVIDCENLLSIVEGKGYPQSVRARDTRAHVACIEKVTVGCFSRGSEAISPSHGTRHGHIHPATLKYIGSP